MSFPRKAPSPGSIVLLLVLAAALLLGVRYELESARSVHAREYVGVIGGGHGIERLAADERYVLLEYTDPVRVLGVDQKTEERLAQRFRSLSAKLQWSDDLLGWTDAGPEASTETGALRIEATEPAAHRYWRVLVTRAPAVVMIGVLDVRYPEPVAASIAQAEDRRAALRADLAFTASCLLLAALCIVALTPDALRRWRKTLSHACSQRSTGYWVLGLALLAYYNYYYLLKFDVVPIPSIGGDSGSYIVWRSLALPGYSAILHGFRWLAGDLSYFVAFQLNLLLVALLALGYWLSRLLRSFAPGMLLLLLVFQGERTLAYVNGVLTEAPFTALLALHLAAVFALCVRFTRLRCALAGLALAGVCAIKAIGFTLLVPAAIAGWFGLRGRTFALSALIGPAVVFLIGLCSYNVHRIGDFTTSTLGGLQLLGKSWEHVGESPDGPHPKLAAELSRKLSHLASPLHEPGLSPFEHAARSRSSFDDVVWNIGGVAVADYVAENFMTAEERQKIILSDRSLATASRIASELARDSIRRHPGDYAYDVLAHYLTLWRELLGPDVATGTSIPKTLVCRTLDGVRSGPAGAAKRDAVHWIESHLPAGRIERACLPGNFARARVEAPALPSLPTRGLIDAETRRVGSHWLSLAVLLIGLAGCTLVFFYPRLPRDARGLCLTGLYVNAYVLGTALTGDAFLRYTIPVQPIAWMIPLLAAATLLRWSRGAAGAQQEEGTHHDEARLAA